MACLSAKSKFCHPHAFTGLHHRLMRFLRRILPCIMIAVLYAPVVIAEEDYAEQIVAKCKQYGFKLGTDAFADCTMRLDEQHDMALRQRAAITAQEEEDSRLRRMRFFSALANSNSSSFMGSVGQAVGGQPQQQPTYTNCLSNRAGINCTTYPGR